MSEPNLRQAVRGLLIDTSDRVLLMEQAFGDAARWVLPGGGIEPGEDHKTALRRELQEEVGLPEPFIGPMLFRRRFLTDKMNRYDGQMNHVYLVPCHDFEPKPTMTEEELAAEGVSGSRWWTVAEMEASSDQIRPESLAELTRQVLEHGAPEEPLYIESRG